MYSRSTGEVNSNRVTSSLHRKWTRLSTNAHEVGALTFKVTNNFGSNDVLLCGAYGTWSGTLKYAILLFLILVQTFFFLLLLLFFFFFSLFLLFFFFFSSSFSSFSFFYSFSSFICLFDCLFFPLLISDPRTTQSVTLLSEYHIILISRRSISFFYSQFYYYLTDDQSISVALLSDFGWQMINAVIPNNYQKNVPA